MADDLQSKIDELTATVAAEETVEDSAIALINGFSAELAAAVAAAQAAGASPTQLASLQSLNDSVTAKSTALAAAVSANTPAAP